MTDTGGTDSEAGTIDAAPATPRLVGWWKLDEGRGMIVNDSSGSGNNGTVLNTAEWGQGALILSATNKAVVEMPVFTTDFPALDGAKTISLWVYYNTVPTATENLVVLSDHMGDHVQFAVRDGILKVTGDNQATFVTTTTAAPAAAAWHHLVYTDDGAGTPAIYVDGVASQTRSGAALPAGTTGYVRIGSWTTDSTSQFFEHFVGSVADVRVYDQALSPADVTALYNAGRSGAPDQVDASAANTSGGAKSG
jgi:hypothetical protein